MRDRQTSALPDRQHSQQARAWLQGHRATERRLRGVSTSIGIFLLVFTIVMGHQHVCDQYTIVLASVSNGCVACINSYRPWGDRVQATVFAASDWYFVADYEVTTPGWTPVGTAWCEVLPKRYGLWLPCLERWDRSLTIQMSDGSVPLLADAAMIRAEFFLFLPRRSEHHPRLPAHYANDFGQDLAPLWRVRWPYAVIDAVLLCVALGWARFFFAYRILNWRLGTWSVRMSRGQCPMCAYQLDPAIIGCPECGWLRSAQADTGSSI